MVNLSTDNDFSVRIYKNDEIKIDNCNFNNTNGLYLLKIFVNVINNNIK